MVRSDEGRPVNPEAANFVIKDFLREIRRRLDDAAQLAKAAEACAEAGHLQKGIEVILDTEQLIYEANTLLNGASLINRISES